MTAHIILTTLVTAIFISIVRDFYKMKSQNTLLLIKLSASILLLLPITFPQMTVIAHYLFEGFGSNLSFYILGNSALILWAGYYVRKVYFLETDNIAKLWSVLAWLVLPAWLYFAVAGSHYEAGPGIVLFNSKFYITYWASICAFIVGTFFPLVSICVKQRKFIMLGVAVLLAAVFGLIMVAAFS